MEMMEGGELFHRISQHKHFTEKMASQVTKQISQALAHCHFLNIAHRDLKPENLLFKDNSLVSCRSCIYTTGLWRCPRLVCCMEKLGKFRNFVSICFSLGRIRIGKKNV
ncbi:hypothetical protein XENOCAPTIV_024483 [Xenoophorus captivus]|uniref:Protein kinase domain-containing protein n=1 Tax=Xenoophorus captivus TaxID=1517983 RepID=A0ABV0RA90_9TELE